MALPSIYLAENCAVAGFTALVLAMSKVRCRPYATDAAALAAARIPMVVLGLGFIAQAHTADEFIEVVALRLATEIFEQIASEGLNDVLSG